MKEKKLSDIYKILPVIKILFPTASHKYPLFFAMESLKTLIQIVQPFLTIFMTPLLVDELCTSQDVKRIATYVAIIVVGECFLRLLVEGINTILQKYQERLNNYFTILMGKHAMELDFQLTEDKKALDQLEKAKTGMTWYSGGVYGIAEQVFMFVGNVFKIVGFVTLIAVYAPLLLVVILGYVAINGYLTSKRNQVELTSYARLSSINRLFGYFGWEIVDFRYGKDIRLYDARRMMLHKWRDYTKKSNDTWQWQADSVGGYLLVGSSIGILRQLFTYFYVGILALRKVISIGIFTQMIETAGALDATLGGLVWNVTELMKRCNYAYEYVLFMDYPQAIPKGKTHVKKGLHHIEFRDVSFAYPGTDKKVLDGINIIIEPGEHLSIVGLNGAGKTTFIKLLCRLYDPTEGEILLDGRNIKEYDYVEYMNQFAPVFQDFKLFGFSIGENIALMDSKAQTPEEKQKLDGLLKQVELDGMLEKLDKGVETKVFKIVEEDGVEPSGGEQQKMAIARALYKDAPVIILDEPTAALDPIAEYEIYRQFDTLVGDKTAFYISHRLSSCRFCDKIAVFSEGKIAEYGNHDELVDIPDGIYQEMFEAQAQYYR